ncbi:PspA/IM30 family protein [Metabacillus herbersteinensis]|uniref:PspA/IM30 family protein n=1 Tax=Metabacillus herbersteinensis TaxID=283816 RepID=A0ABV6GCE5_9BACI
MFEMFKRMKTIVSSEMNALIDKAEDPVLLVDQYLRDMSKEVQDMEKATAKMMAEEKLVGKKVADLKELISKRENQAMEALKLDREDLAKRALEDKARLQKELVHLDVLHTQALQSVVDLKEKLTVMKSEYRNMEMKRDTLKARAMSAKARKSVNAAMSSSNSDSASKGFQRMEEKVLQYEAEAETSEDLFTGGKSLDQELSELNRESELDLEMQRLKDQLNNEKKI